MFKRFKNLRLSTLLANILITLAYPAFKAFRAPINRLQMFIDATTIIACLLVILGIIFSMVLHGDFDIAGLALRMSVKKGQAEPPETYMANRRDKRAEMFNYPLFLGLVYLAVSALIAYTVL